jgi:hypothetical protein
LKNNARALKCFADIFGTTSYEVLPDVNLSLKFAGILITVNPDLRVTEKGTEKLLKLEFAAEEPGTDLIKIISQAMFEAALSEGMNLSSSQVLYVDVPRGVRHKGARLGALTRKNIEASCSNIAAIWSSL